MDANKEMTDLKAAKAAKKNAPVEKIEVPEAKKAKK
jgi:hypothetical protein